MRPHFPFPSDFLAKLTVLVAPFVVPTKFLRRGNLVEEGLFWLTVGGFDIVGKAGHRRVKQLVLCSVGEQQASNGDSAM